MEMAWECYNNCVYIDNRGVYMPTPREKLKVADENNTGKMITVHFLKSNNELVAKENQKKAIKGCSTHEGSVTRAITCHGAQDFQITHVGARHFSILCPLGGDPGWWKIPSHRLTPIMTGMNILGTNYDKP